MPFRNPFCPALAALLACAAPALAGEPPRLALPIACEPGKTCFVQHYVDRDPGSGIRDYMCGNASYDGHDGIDFRVPTTADMRRGVAVRAAATGQVVGVRDGEPDQDLSAPRGGWTEGKECGNGVVVDHGGGWRTQYCHMEAGSLRARQGEQVRAGQELGLVGLSGMTQFPHLHFTVRKDGAAVDPFAFGAPEKACGAGRSLWEPSVASALAYAPRIVLNAGFSGSAPTMASIESGDAAANPAGQDAPVLAFYVRAIRLQPGDVQEVTILGPDGSILAQSAQPALDRGKAQYFVFVGRKRPPSGFAPGTYVGRYVVLHGGQPVLTYQADQRM